MPIFNLPRFRENTVVPQADRAGTWVGAPASLKALGSSLLVDTDRPDESQATIIRAIPDPWAQARTFAEAVVSKDHSLHKAAIAQWRGLLALFALADVRKADYSVDFQPLTLGSDTPLERVLRHLAPQVGFAGNGDLWLRPYIVYLNPKRGQAAPVAILNPASLVAPGRTTWRLPFEFIPWMHNGLGDPLELSDKQALTNTDLAALEAYLRNLYDTLPRAGDDHAGAIAHALETYIDAVRDRRGPTMIEAEVRRSADSSLPALYRELLRPAELQEPDDPAAVSECRLKILESDKLGQLKGVVLIDESVTVSHRRAARDILAWGNKSLSMLLDSPQELQLARTQAADRGWLIVTADDLFTPRMVRLRKEPRIDGHNPDMRDLLEPIRPLVLLLDQEQTRGVEAEATDRRATVTLYLKLDGPTVTPSHAISRTYRADADVTEPQLVNDVDWGFGQTSIWPNFRSRNWPFYFARLSYPTTREQIRPKTALSRSILVAALAQCETAQHAVQTIRAINDGQAPAEREQWFRRFQSVAGKAYEELQTSDQAFEAVFYVDYHPDRGEAPAGCARLKLIDTVDRDIGTSVAIDFGSTNSVACLAGSNGQPVTLQGRIIHPIRFQDAARNDEWQHIVRWNYVEFLPLADRRTPTPTVVIRRNDADRNADLWLYRNLIYFPPTANYAEGGVGKEIETISSYLSRSEFNLKWNEDPEHIDASADFLEQFMTMVAAEAAAAQYNVRRMDWHFSVPDAMRGTRLASFRQQVEVARQRLSPDGKLYDLYSEGLAAARFILSGREGAKFTPGTINAILDIGGSTTDITLWAGDKLIWKGSFRLAGRAFFTEALVQNPEILHDIELGDWADLMSAANAGNAPPEFVGDVGELLFSRPQLEEAFDKHWNRRLAVKTGESLRAVALVYLSGIAYYLGVVAKRLVADGVLTEADLKRPAFALCGRGAGIFRRIHGGQRPDAESFVTNALQTFGRAIGAGSITRPQLFISQQPKLEVAAGMMVDFKAIDASVGSGVAKSSFTPAALAVGLADDQAIAADSGLDEAATDAAVRGSDLESLLQFLDDFADLTDIKVDLRKSAGQGAFFEINNVVRQKVDSQRDDSGALRLVEPPFITALGALVTIMADTREERETRMSVEFGG